MKRDYAAFTRDFERCEIDASDFGHIDHIGVAWDMLHRYDFLEASLRYSRCIDTIATRAGAGQKFNTTITLAFLSLVAERMKQGPDGSFDEFIARNEDLLAPGVLDRWYSAERLGSDLARSVFLMPDAHA